VLFNNAGLSRGKDELIHANIDHWEEMIDTNIKGFLYVAKAVLPIMKEQGSGYIINTGSVAGRNSYVGGNVYGATKAAVKMLSESMRLEAAAYGVRVGEIAPGAAETEFSMVRFDQNKETSDAVYKGFIPLNGQDIANTVWFLSNLPEHVCIQELVIMPTAQPNANVVYRK
jgi:NADP-dependent 3-hydroxy acid dehydrogenase YdfG